MSSSVDVDPASRPFRFVARAFLRRTSCTLCQGVLEIVWIKTPQPRGLDVSWSSGLKLSWDNMETIQIALGYRCQGCGQVTRWNGAEVLPP